MVVAERSCRVHFLLYSDLPYIFGNPQHLQLCGWSTGLKMGYEQEERTNAFDLIIMPSISIVDQGVVEVQATTVTRLPFAIYRNK
jgi:hypothetical protein